MALTAKANTGAATDVLATDVIGAGAAPASGEHVPLTKILLGALGSNGGVVGAGNPLPVDVAPLGTTGDAAATTDAGTFSLIALTKRLLGKIPSLGSAVSASSQPVVIASDQAAVAVKNSQNVATGTFTAASQTVQITITDASAVVVQFDGTFSGLTASFEVSNDGTNWDSTNCVRMANSAGAPVPNFSTGSISSSTTLWSAYTGGAQFFRVRSAAFSSGTANVRIRSVAMGTPLWTAIASITGAISVSAVTSSNSGIPGIITDVSSAAITTTTTTAAFTPTFGTSYEVNIPVTVVTGTTPTLDVVVQESDDNGTNWFDVYAFPRITATGIYRSPKLPLTGNRVRYAQTVTGTTPSFTRAINRLQGSEHPQPIRQLIDRTVVPTTLNSTTPSLNVQNCRNLQLVINLGAATTPQTMQLEGSDDNGLTWYAIGGTLAGVASSTVQLTVSNVNAQLVRARVSTAGTGVTLGYVLIKGF